jgi:hypothetical protein
MRVPYWPQQGERNYRQLVDAAQRWNKVPEGKRIVTDLDRDRDELEIRLVDAPEGSVIAPTPVPVPERLSKPHPVARQYRDDTKLHCVSRAQLSRAVRIVHALAVECNRRAYEIRKLSSELPPRRGYANRSMKGSVDFEVVLRGHRYPLHISEEKVPLRGVWEDEQQWRKEQRYFRQTSDDTFAGRYDKNGTGRLTLALDGYSRNSRQASWGDRRSWTLEEKLPDILREIEVRAVEDDHRAEEQRQKEEERQRQWGLAMERAKARYIESYRAKALRAHAVAWQEANELRAYLAALEEAHGDDPEAAEWIKWVRSYIERLDPLNRSQRLPTPEEISAEDLKPFLGGVSPYGPRGW